jgi:hypothetical protein
MIDPIGALISELRGTNIASKRVRGGEPAQGDAQPAGSFQRFVVLSRLGAVRLHRAPMQTVRIGVRAYAPTFQDAAALYGEISDALDNAGPRLSASGVAIYNTLDETGGSGAKDPDTGQPYEDGILEVVAGTETVQGS